MYKEVNPNVELLVKALGLEVVSVSSIGEEIMKPKSESEVNSEFSAQGKDDEAIKTIMLEQEKRWHGRNLECHKCHHSHEGINGTYCGKLHQYVEYGKGNCEKLTGFADA